MSDYPTEEELGRIRTWADVDASDPHGLFAYVKALWWPDGGGWGWREYTDRDGARYYHISTGGWSGNEDIIDAMQEALVFVLYHVESHRGGHFLFRVPA